ncbi:hypothetical protein QBC37DRAFT_369236 [Rhypophila decipiens]|uniref:Uncharacterized protein n=1 Tax=Rhypophila decipiens TaxID=261697 RepID=A0AAN7BEP3_9PEZI|nr:hypothetical protein QBC37DRAFT_369236 [Rhypophila decipiens]
MTSSSKRRERDDERGSSTIADAIRFVVVALLFLVQIVLPTIFIAGSALLSRGGGPVEYMVAIQDHPSPDDEVNWYGWATYWCSHEYECKGIWDHGKRPNSEYIVSEKIDRIRVGDSNDLRWQYRRTMVDVDQGKWAVEEFRHVKDLSALINSPKFEDFGHLNVEADKKIQYQAHGLNQKNRVISKLMEGNSWKPIDSDALPPVLEDPWKTGGGLEHGLK